MDTDCGVVVAADIMAEVAGEDFTEEAGADVHLAVAEVVVADLEAVASVAEEAEAELMHSAAEAAVGAALSRTSNVRPAEVAAASNFHRREVLAVVEVAAADLVELVGTQLRAGHKVSNRARPIDNQCAPAETLPHVDRIANRCDRVVTPLRVVPAQTDSQCVRVVTFRRADQTASLCAPAATTLRGDRIVFQIWIPIAVR